MRIRLTLSAILISASTVAADEISPVETLRTTFPREVEMNLALTGAPIHLRAGASVYVYGDAGFERIRVGTNGITCLLNRGAFFYGAEQFKPTCWDAVGEKTYIPVMLKVGELLAKGQGADEIRAAIDAGFANGTFRAPTTGGVAYMLAGDVELDLRTGQVSRQAYPGHYMFYAMGSTTAQFGVTRAARADNPTLPSVFAGGAGGDHGLSYIIVAPTALGATSHEH
jgi:hypothetical protein